ncbi:coiled-coil domain-containing protein 167-like isoform X2 [Ornithodoros turicata]|uniref:coiled-coil domain-containing protein 167-like isoform X2 n=1 Tax=Ornithodoros turicata TaxID=34597 RepID=UPI00313946CC
MPDVDTSKTSVLKELETLETTLRRTQMTDEERLKVEDDVKTVKNQLANLEKQLGHLRKENRKSMAIAACLFVLFLMLYYFLMVRTITG